MLLLYLFSNLLFLAFLRTTEFHFYLIWLLGLFWLVGWLCSSWYTLLLWCVLDDGSQWFQWVPFLRDYEVNIVDVCWILGGDNCVWLIVFGGFLSSIFSLVRLYLMMLNPYLFIGIVTALIDDVTFLALISAFIMFLTLEKYSLFVLSLTLLCKISSHCISPRYL